MLALVEVQYQNQQGQLQQLLKRKSRNKNKVQPLMVKSVFKFAFPVTLRHMGQGIESAFFESNESQQVIQSECPHSRSVSF